MIKVDPASPSPSPPEPSFPPSLAYLSRNASAISTSSSDSTPSEPLLAPRPRPIRTFSGPRSRSPGSLSPGAMRPSNYLAQELGYYGDDKALQAAEAKAKARSKSRGGNSVATVEDFKFGATLGDGSYSTVKLGTHLASGKEFAIKVIEKSHLITKKKQSTAHAERNALMRLGAAHPGIVRMWYSFQDQWRLYFVLDLAKNGEMKTLLNRIGSLSLECCRYYSAQLVDIIQYMHSKDVIHRDLKPENLLLDENFRIKLTDFGTGKVMEPGISKSYTWVGTAQYIAPELLLAKESSKATDFWALGCIIYQMIAGRFAFVGLSDFLTFEKIKNHEYSFPDGFDEQAKNLVERLLTPDPSERLGAGLPGTSNDIQVLRSHPFFASISWSTLWTDLPPTLESGLLKKEGRDAQGNLDGISAAWDDLVDGSDEDELDWAPDAHGPAFDRKVRTVNGSPTVDVGPLNEIRYHSFRTRRDTGSTIHGNERPIAGIVEDLDGNTGNGHDLRESPSRGSLHSSSDGSPARNLDTMLESVSLNASQISPAVDRTAHTFEDNDERGRSPNRSPIQGNGPTSNVNFALLLKLPDGEKIIFNSSVEARTLRRRASRLIPLPVSTNKRKTRQLILTSNRLFCLKQQTAGTISVKSELSLQASSEKLKEKDKEKESRSIVSGVEKKGDREFIVLTSSKAYSYFATDAGLASTWIQMINEGLALHAAQD